MTEILENKAILKIRILNIFHNTKYSQNKYILTVVMVKIKYELTIKEESKEHIIENRAGGQDQLYLNCL